MTIYSWTNQSGGLSLKRPEGRVIPALRAQEPSSTPEAKSCVGHHDMHKNVKLGKESPPTE